MVFAIDPSVIPNVKKFLNLKGFSVSLSLQQKLFPSFPDSYTMATSSTDSSKTALTEKLREDSVDLLRNIFEQLTEKEDSIVLVGERGVGKTWIAKKISEHATRGGQFHFTIWIFLNKKYDEKTLCESIARQLSITFSAEEWETERKKEDAKKEENKAMDLQGLKEKIHETLERKKFLLILDDEGSEDEANTWGKLNVLLPSPIRVLSTCVDNKFFGEIPVTRFSVNPLTEAASFFLAEKKMGKNFDTLPVNLQKLGKDFIKECKGLPAKIILWAKVFIYYENQDFGLKALEGALEKAFSDKNYDIVQLLWSADPYRFRILIDCCWGGSHFFRGRGGVHYNELITYWILEGYLGRIDSIEKAYEAGHCVLMDLLDCRILKELEAGYVIMYKHELDLYAQLQPGFGATAGLGLATVLNPERDVFCGRITHGDGIMKSVDYEDGQYVSTLMCDGSQLIGEVPLDSFLENKQKLRVLAFFNSTIRSLSSLLSDMKSLRVLIFRGCDIMDVVKEIFYLENLTVLEISGPSCVKILPEDFFDKMPNLQILNLSELDLTSLPASLYSCQKINWLILRRCPKLESLGNVQKLTELMVLDLSDSTSLSSIKDKHLLSKMALHTINLSNTRIKIIPIIKDLENLTHLFLSDCTEMGRLRGMASLDKLLVLGLSNSKKFKEFHDQSLGTMTALKVIDLSGCSINRLPANISNPSYLYLRGCPRLKKLFSLEILKALEVLDVSGSSRLVEVEPDFFKQLTVLRVLNLSKTIVKSLPSVSSLFSLRELLISHCAALEELKGLDSLKQLEVIDLSHCSALKSIDDNSFQHMSRLQMLDLSYTKIKTLPSLSRANSLRRLILKKCTNLELGPLPNLSKIVELNLSSVRLVDGDANFVDSMCELEILDLSETNLEHLPSMSKHKFLNQLYLRGCQHLNEVIGLGELTELEILDLSGTAVSRLENLHCLCKLRHLLLRDCSNIQEMLQPTIIDLLQPNVAKLPCRFTELTHLELLDLPRKDTQGSDTTKNPREHQNQHQWIISSWQAEALKNNDDEHIISVSGTQFLDLFEGNPNMLTTSFQKFRYLICPTEMKNTCRKKYIYKDELIFRDTWSTAEVAHSMQRSLEIRGFKSYPEGVEQVLSHAKFVILIDNPCIKWVSESYLNSMKELEGCWIERCNEMECVVKVNVTAESGQQLKEITNLEGGSVTRKAAGAIGLKSVTDIGNLQRDSFNNLKYFYLNFCPKLSVVFPSSQRLENLEILEIKFCAELESLFEEESAELPRLIYLHLSDRKKLLCGILLQTTKVSSDMDKRPFSEGISLTCCAVSKFTIPLVSPVILHLKYRNTSFNLPISLQDVSKTKSLFCSRACFMLSFCLH
ncbi:Disease resistance protein [Heracleum sosnowskyi]|uniref:Disease resistance protein n=1 Tax=Heracleum sosnowskyi TaxID=360622 RepID=A0AAD8IJ36_9APIA|nr:Disease resistance protein [Heracleum sosnowskyi]